MASDLFPSLKRMKSLAHSIFFECSTCFRRLAGIPLTGTPPEELLYRSFLTFLIGVPTKTTSRGDDVRV